MRYNVLSVVCARSGSKGVRNKCVTKINGKMVAEYAVEYSQSLGRNIQTVVSTDIIELINYCKTNEIGFIERCPRYCTDESRVHDALADAIEKHGRDMEYCSLVYGNIPIRYEYLFQKALSFLKENKDYDAIISMQNVEKYHPEWMFDYNEEILPARKEKHYRRQMLPQKMIHDGHTLLFRSDKFMEKYKGHISYDKEDIYSSFGDKIKPFINDEVIIDIDSRGDIKLAKAVILSDIF